MQILPDVKLDFDDVLIIPKRSKVESRKQVDLSRKFKFEHHELNCTPLVAANMFSTGSTKMAQSLAKQNCLVALHKFHTFEELVQLDNDNIFITVGQRAEEREILEKLKSVGKSPRMICLDVANGYTEKFMHTLNEIRTSFKTSILMAGNVCTAEATAQLILSGADIVKVGIGPGSLCSTRLVTGVGYPQLSAIIECKDAAHGLGKYICADGGCKNASDVCKAFGAGTDFLMLGGMLNGVDECNGEWKYEEMDSWGKEYVHMPLSPSLEKDAIKLARFAKGVQVEIHDPQLGMEILGRPKLAIHFPSVEYTNQKKSLKIYGMSSLEAQMKHYGKTEDYKAPEGESREVAYKGLAEDVIKQILGGLRSCCAYSGAVRLKDLNKCCTFVRVNRVK